MKSRPRGPLPLKHDLMFCMNLRRIDFSEYTHSADLQDDKTTPQLVITHV